jgi:hypothetical protein
MPQIILEPGNPLDLRPEELEPLISAIRDLDSSYDVKIAYDEPRGYAVTWWEVLHVWLPWVGAAAGGAAITKIVELLIEWSYNRFKQEPERKRPKHIPIYGYNGKVVKSITIMSDDQEPEDSTPNGPQIPRKLPPIR